jgi:hypothetical protein
VLADYKRAAESALAHRGQRRRLRPICECVDADTRSKRTRSRPRPSRSRHRARIAPAVAAGFPVGLFEDKGSPTTRGIGRKRRELELQLGQTTRGPLPAATVSTPMQWAAAASRICRSSHPPWQRERQAGGFARLQRARFSKQRRPARNVPGRHCGCASGRSSRLRTSSRQPGAGDRLRAQLGIRLLRRGERARLPRRFQGA